MCAAAVSYSDESSLSKVMALPLQADGAISGHLFFEWAG
jgi:hypothetical protein